MKKEEIMSTVKINESKGIWKVPIRFVREEVIDDSNSGDVRKMVRGEKQIAGPEAWLGDNKHLRGVWRNIG